MPQERGVEGLVLYLSIGPNITLADINGAARRIPEPAERDLALKWIKRIAIKTPGPQALCLNLSGGNQQKVVLSKWLATKVKIMVLDHPTRGIDVGAKEEVYELIRELADRECLPADRRHAGRDHRPEQSHLHHEGRRRDAGFAAPADNKPMPLDLIQYMM